MKIIKRFPELHAVLIKNRYVKYILTSDTSKKNIEQIKQLCGSTIEIVFKPSGHIDAIIASHENNRNLWYLEQLYSVVTYSTPFSIIFSTLLLITLIIALFIILRTNNDLALLILTITLSLPLVILSIYKIILFIMRFDLKKSVYDLEIPQDELPIYSVLVPMFKENEITISNLIDYLQQIIYDKNKLEIIILLEENDNETLSIIKNYDLPKYMKILLVPDANLKTKPRACNYGLEMANGEFITIYDAEDKPELDQLLKSVALFKSSEPEVMCLQGKLCYYNSNENWITRLFSIEYLTWFDFFLPIIAKLNVPIPLGGTSNHFRTSFLKEIGGWDAHNVTEDASLGILIYMLGYKVLILDSFTYEEANCEFYNWIKQRTRWIKGHITTCFVFSSNIGLLYRKLGFWKFIHFILFFWVGAFTSILTAICLTITILCATINYPIFTVENVNIKLAFTYYTIFSIIIYIFHIIIGIIVAWTRGNKKIIYINLLLPLYHLMSCLSGLRAYWQLIFKPYHWEKTAHGISKLLTVKFIKKRLD